MAVIKCKECGKELSDQALTCPHCGGHTEAWMIERQNKKKRTRTIWLNIFSGVLFLALLGIAFGSHDSIGCLLGRWENGGELEWKYVLEVLGCFFAFGVVCVVFTIKRPRIFKVISVCLFCLYFITALTYIVKGYINDVRPAQEFRNTYCNKNVINALKDSKLAWGDDVVISFHDEMLVFSGAINNMDLPINSVTDEGEIYVNCTVSELKKIFGDKLKDYFTCTKETASAYLDSKDEHYFSISPVSYDLGFSILYVGYFANNPKTSYRPTYGYHGSYGEMADGVRISSLDYEGVGWFRLQAYGYASIITSE